MKATRDGSVTVGDEQDSDAPLCCDHCGEPYFVDEDGVSHHVSEEDPQGIDFDADADHVPYGG